ncbi:MAG: hypothetical protein ACRDPA_21655, partial [Solirubrobacteraceae bacterium]
MGAASFAAINNDLPLTANDSLQKEADAAAQAGVQNYLFALDQDSEFWTQCVPTGSTWINNAGATPLKSRPVSGSSTESYAVELLPAAGQNTYTQCSTANPVASMIQSSGTGAGTIRIRSTGYAGTVKRTVVANLREQSFLDYEYFTEYETSDPLLQVAYAYQETGDTTIEPPDLCALEQPPIRNCGSNYTQALSGAAQQCAQYRYPPPAGIVSTAGYDRYTTPFYGNNYCDQIQFAPQDVINGPFHSNDQVLVCGGATFGRTRADNVEFGGPSPGYVEVGGSGCNGLPNIKGTAVTASILTPPPSNGSLKTIAAPADTFTGTTCVTLTAAAITYSQPNATYPSCFTPGIPTTSIGYPANGVLYVSNGSCALSYDVENPSYTGNTGCGTVYVKGIDGPPLTIAAENDIVIDGNLTYNDTSASMLGLIANNFIRVYHPVGSQPLGTNSGACSTSMSNSPDPLRNGVTIDAMLLSLQHSFDVDQYN